MIKLIAHFDTAGKIHSIMSVHSAPTGAAVGMVPSAGLHAAELDAGALGLSADVSHEKLAEIARTHTIADPIIKRALIKRPG